MIENYRTPKELGYAIAVFDVYLEKSKLRFFNVKLNKSKKGHHYLSFPSYMSGEDFVTSKKEFHPYYQFSEETQKAFEEQLYKELNELVPGGLNRYKN